MGWFNKRYFCSYNVIKDGKNHACGDAMVYGRFYSLETIKEKIVNQIKVDGYDVDGISIVITALNEI